MTLAKVGKRGRVVIPAKERSHRQRNWPNLNKKSPYPKGNTDENGWKTATME